MEDGSMEAGETGSLNARGPTIIMHYDTDPAIAMVNTN